MSEIIQKKFSPNSFQLDDYINNSTFKVASFDLFWFETFHEVMIENVPINSTALIFLHKTWEKPDQNSSNQFIECDL